MPVNSNKFAKAENNKKIFHLWLVRGLILAFCLWVAFILTGRVLCEIALDQIAELTNTEITTESVSFSINGSVFIKKLVIGPQQQKKYDDAILKAETVYARFGIGSLLFLHPRLKKIIVKDFVFDAQHDLDTDWWNIAGFRIKPPKSAAGKMPIIRLKRGMLQYSKISNGQAKVIAAVPIDVGFVPALKTQDGYSFNITTAKRIGLDKSILTGFWEPGRITITGGISSADIPAFEKAWMINALEAQLNYDRSGTYSLKLKIEDLQSRHTSVGGAFAANREVFLGKSRVFIALQRFFNQYQPSGTVAIELQASGNFERLSESTLVGKVYCKDISICDRSFPYPIKQLTGQIDLTENGAVLNNLCGKHDNTEVTFNGWSEDFGPNWKYQISITSDNMVLDNALYEALSAKQKKCWSAFSPSGLASIDYRISRHSQANEEEILEVKLLGVEAAYSHFPYPLRNLSGRLVFTKGSMNISDVISQVNDCKITLNGNIIAYSTDRPVCDISVNAKDVPLDSTLATILLEKEGDFYNRFDMTGLADADIKIFTPEQNFSPTSFIANVALKKASLFWGLNIDEADDFLLTSGQSHELVISDISAKTIITPESIRIEDFTGRYNNASVSLTGQIWPGDKNQKPCYSLLFSAEQTELNDKIISLLPQQIERILSELQPVGRVNLAVNLNKTGSGGYPDYEITVDCPGNSINFELFAYPVKEITGRLTITNNAITLEDITATATDNTLLTSNTSTVKINGRVILSEDVFSGGCLELSRGDITFIADNLRIGGKSVTLLKADAYYDPSRRSWIAKNLVAGCYGGTLAGKFELKRSAEAELEYLMQVSFDNIDVKQYLSDTNSGGVSCNDQTNGKMSGVLSIAGRTGKHLPYIGRCRLLITDMQLGRLSPLAKLLYVLKLTEPKDFAFERMLVDSYIKHNSLFIKQFDLSGRAVAFNGSGRIDLQSRNADLVLFARGRRLVTSEPSILQSLTEGIGQGVVRMEVTGDVYDPRVKATTLPVINEVVKILVAPRR
jgi:hypothetical protein